VAVSCPDFHKRHRFSQKTQNFIKGTDLHKRHRISYLYEWFLASEEGLYHGLGQFLPLNENKYTILGKAPRWFQNQHCVLQLYLLQTSELSVTVEGTAEQQGCSSNTKSKICDERQLVAR